MSPSEIQFYLTSFLAEGLSEEVALPFIQDILGSTGMCRWTDTQCEAKPSWCAFLAGLSEIRGTTKKPCAPVPLTTTTTTTTTAAAVTTTTTAAVTITSSTTALDTTATTGGVASGTTHTTTSAVTLYKCTPGVTLCRCDDSQQCAEASDVCMNYVCRLSADAEKDCEPGTRGCACSSQRMCYETLTCVQLFENEFRCAQIASQTDTASTTAPTASTSSKLLPTCLFISLLRMLWW